jgi:GntR family transcriptional regulator
MLAEHNDRAWHPAAGSTNTTEPLSSRDGVPLYVQLKNILSTQLHEGRWMPGDQLPTEPELSRQFGVSEGTVRQAVLALVKDGQLTRRSGKGTFVAKRKFEDSFARFFRFRTDAGDGSLQIVVRTLSVQTSRDEEAANILRLRKGAELLRIHRSIGQRDSTICHYDSFLPYDRFKGLKREDFQGHALYDVLQSKYNIHIVRATEILHAGRADARDAEILGTKTGEPVISINRTAFTYRNLVVEFRRTVGRGDKFFYEAELK